MVSESMAQVCSMVGLPILCCQNWAQKLLNQVLNNRRPVLYSWKQGRPKESLCSLQVGKYKREGWVTYTQLFPPNSPVIGSLFHLWGSREDRKDGDWPPFHTAPALLKDCTWVCFHLWCCQCNLLSVYWGFLLVFVF